jgi:hypothetical protein
MRLPPGVRVGPRWLLAGAFACAALLVACSDDDSGGVAPPADDGPQIVSVVAERVSGEVGESFSFAVAGADNLPEGVSFAWDFGDGQTSALAAPSVIYSSGGFFSVRGEVRDGVDLLAEGELLVTVVDPALPAMDFLGNPVVERLGDVDGDGQLALRDLQLLRQHLAGLQPFAQFEALEAADVDLDGAVDEADATFLAASLLQGDLGLRGVLPAEPRAGQLLTVYSPALADLATTATLDFGSGSGAPLARLRPGLVTAILPAEALPGAVLLARLQVDGLPVEEFELQVAAGPALASDFEVAVSQYFALVQGQRAAGTQAIETQLAQLVTDGVLSAEEAEVLGSMIALAADDLVLLEAEIVAMIGELDAEERAEFAAAALANGFAEALAGLEDLGPAPLQAFAAGADTLATLCALEALAGAIEFIDQGAQALCFASLALTGGLAVLPIDGPFGEAAAFATAVTACTKYAALSTIPTLVASLLPTVGDKLTLVAQGPTQLEPGQSVQFEPRLEVNGLSVTCALAEAAAIQGQQAVIAELSKQLAHKLLKQHPALVHLFTVAKLLGPETTAQFFEKVTTTVAGVLGATPVLGTVLSEATAKLCDHFLVGNQGNLPVDAGLLFSSLEPDFGTLTSDVLLTYTCPTVPADPPIDQVTIRAELPVCSGLVVGTATVTCGELKPVTITMGDNGSLLDDIYEVRIDGEFFLTSSVPVTSTSKSTELTVGDHLLEMAGKAAPDGIGTYFIIVSGGQLLNGPPTSGSNLVPGVTHSWTLRVQ